MRWAAILLVLAGCTTERMCNCFNATCPSPTHPVWVSGYKQASVCVCAPPEEPDTFSEGTRVVCKKR